MPIIRREAKRQDEPEDSEADVGKLQEYIDEAKSRRREVRAHGTRKLHELAVNTQGFDRHEGVIDDVLEICRGSLDASRDAIEREMLVEIAGIVLVTGSAPEGFTADFAQGLGKELEGVFAAGQANLGVSMMHCILVAQALEGNAVKAEGTQGTLSDYLLKHKPPHDATLAGAYCRLVAATADREDQAEAVGTLLRHQLHVHTDPDVAAVIVKAVALAVEHHGEACGLHITILEPLEQLPAKTQGSKDAKKELTTAVREVEQYIRTSKVPTHTVSFQIPHSRNERIDVPIQSFVQLAVLDSVRQILGDQYYSAMLGSKTLRAYFNIDIPWEDNAALRRHILGQQQIAESHDRTAASKNRDKGRERARDSKRGDHDDE
jgi:hypothetical protein